MQAEMNHLNLRLSQRDARSVDSKEARSNSTNKSGGRAGKKEKRGQKKSFNMRQPPPMLNNLVHGNFSKTTKIDLREINKQLKAIDYKTGGGSTSNARDKGILIPGTSRSNIGPYQSKNNMRGNSVGMPLNSTREKRDRSTSSKGKGMTVVQADKKMTNLLQANKMGAIANNS